MACDTPYYVKNKKYPHVAGEMPKVPVDCGKCPPCLSKRVSQWVFRLQQEARLWPGSLFVTLTYDTEHVPLTPTGFMTLEPKHLTDFWKRLRANKRVKIDGKWILPPDTPPIRYYACGEYGTKRKRPHYHAIVFNVTEEEIRNAWPYGRIDGQRPKGEEALAYVAKYIDKDQGSSKVGSFAKDDRIKEFSRMSKGLGLNFLTPAIRNYYRKRLDACYLTKLGGHKIAMPRYYREKLWSEAERQKQNKLLAQNYADSIENQYREYLKDNPNADFDTFIDNLRYGRYNSAQSRRGKRDTQL